MSNFNERKLGKPHQGYTYILKIIKHVFRLGGFSRQNAYFAYAEIAIGFAGRLCIMTINSNHPINALPTDPLAF